MLNLDLVQFPHPSVYTLKTDLTHSGQVFNALTSHFGFADYAAPSRPGPPDAVIHLAAHARNLLVPEDETFAANTASTYNVISAACKLGIRKIVIASSETVYGVCFADGRDPEYDSFPLDEDSYDVNPMDPYALSKVCGERVARAFARRYGEEVLGKGAAVDIYVLRIGNVIEPHEYETLFPEIVGKPAGRKRNAWSYVDARDLGQMVHLCIEKKGLGFQIFNATNDNITTQATTSEVLAKYSPGVEVTREMGEFEAPLSNRKIKTMLGFRQEHDWRRYYKP